MTRRRPLLIRVLLQPAVAAGLSLTEWDLLLRQGRRIVGIGTSDWHRGEAPIGAASVRVRAGELSRPAILEGIRAGRVVVMSDAATPPPEIVLRAGERAARVGDRIALKKHEPFVVELAAAGPAYEGATVQLVWRGETIASNASASVASSSTGVSPPIMARSGWITVAIRSETKGIKFARVCRCSPVAIALSAEAASRR